MVELPVYDSALLSVRNTLRALAATGLRMPIAAELQEAVVRAARAAHRADVPLAVLSADLGRLAAEAMLGDSHAIEVGRAMARRAARAYEIDGGEVADRGG